jgi:hypothetical protein
MPSTISLFAMLEVLVPTGSVLLDALLIHINLYTVVGVGLISISFLAVSSIIPNIWMDKVTGKWSNV